LVGFKNREMTKSISQKLFAIRAESQKETRVLRETSWSGLLILRKARADSAVKAPTKEWVMLSIYRYRIADKKAA
jgi:hypothetical protein